MPPRPTRPAKPCPEDCNCGCDKVVPQTIPFPAPVAAPEVTEVDPGEKAEDETAETAVEQRETDEVSGGSELDEASSTFVELYHETKPTEDME